MPFVDRIEIVHESPAFIRIDFFSSIFSDDRPSIKMEDWTEMKRWIDTNGTHGSWHKTYSLFISVQDWTFFRLRFGL